MSSVRNPLNLIHATSFTTTTEPDRQATCKQVVALESHVSRFARSNSSHRTATKFEPDGWIAKHKENYHTAQSSCCSNNASPFYVH
eukprot:136539-Amphidinium_carterae.1